MAALTQERMTRVLRARGMDFPVAASTTIYQGAFVVLDSGYLKPASAAGGTTPVGRASQTVVNSGAAGSVMCHVDFLKERVFFPFMTDPDSKLVAGDLGATVYFLDDQTVTPEEKDEEDNPYTAAGTVLRIEGSGASQVAWVEV